MKADITQQHIAVSHYVLPEKQTVVMSRCCCNLKNFCRSTSMIYVLNIRGR